MSQPGAAPQVAISEDIRQQMLLRNRSRLCPHCAQHGPHPDIWGLPGTCAK